MPKTKETLAPQPWPTHNYGFTRKSRNKKTGPMAVTTTSKESCPPDCPLKDGACYAEAYPLKGRWDEITERKRGVGLPALLALIQTIEPGEMWRHNQAGDLPSADGVINRAALSALADANTNRVGYTYTHHDVIANLDNRQAVRAANDEGFCVNLSGNDLSHADELVDTGAGPVTVLLPADFKGRTTTTPKGRKVSVCPAQLDDTTCVDCGLCAQPFRKSIVGFISHGIRKRAASEIARGEAA